MQIIKMNETENEVNEFKREWSGLADEIFIKDYYLWCNHNEESHILPEQKKIYEKRAKKRDPCYYIWHSMIVLWNGDVTICCRDFNGDYVLGNIMEKTLAEMWNSKKLVALRKMHIKKDVGNTICKDCLDYPNVAPSKLLFTKQNLKKVFRHLKRKSVN